MSALSSKLPLRRAILFFAGAFAILAIIIWVVYYLLVGKYYVATDDAYLAADSSMIASKVSGYVTNVAVHDDQTVHTGDALVTIDSRDYVSARAAAQADISAANAAIQNDMAQLDLQMAKIDSAAAMVKGDDARVAFAAQNQKRYSKLSSTGASTQQNTDQADTDFATAQAKLSADQADLKAATAQVDVLHADLAASQAKLAQANARTQQAELNLGHTQIVAPFSGEVGNKTVTVGEYLQPGTQIMAIVPLSRVYVIANYKETQIGNIAPGQSVSVVVDAFPNLKIHGTVDSIAPASGQEFALLPPDNATGNFTKIVQRVPVKIVLDLTDGEIGKLRPGLSVEPTIDTRPRL